MESRERQREFRAESYKDERVRERERKRIESRERQRELRAESYKEERERERERE